MRPWVINITADVHLPAAGANATDRNVTNTISYRGLFQGKDPAPSRTAGYIMMESNLVFLREERPAAVQAT